MLFVIKNLKTQSVFYLILLCIMALCVGLYMQMFITNKKENIILQESIGCINAVCITYGTRGKQCFETHDRLTKLVISEDSRYIKRVHLEFSNKECR